MKRDASHEGDAPRRTLVVVAWFFVAIFWLLAGLLALMVLPMSAMLFDAPGSEHNPWIWGMIAGMAMVPLLALISVPVAVYGAWRELRKPMRLRVLVVVALLPLLGVFLWGLALAGLQVFCADQLSCSEPWSVP